MPLRIGLDVALSLLRTSWEEGGGSVLFGFFVFSVIQRLPIYPGVNLVRRGGRERNDIVGGRRASVQVRREERRL